MGLPLNEDMSTSEPSSAVALKSWKLIETAARERPRDVGTPPPTLNAAAPAREPTRRRSMVPRSRS
eukprot:3640634-Prymnesium_polylepis.1